MSQHDHGHVVMPAIPAPPLIVIQAELLLELLIVLLDLPAALHQPDQPA
jgi:hypothetical protein